MLAILAIISIIVNFEYSESCSTNGAYFPENGAAAIAILKGTLNGNTVQGTVTFTQAVNINIFFKL